MRSLNLIVIAGTMGIAAAALGGEMVEDQRLSEAASLEEVADAFIPEAVWQRQDASALQERLRISLGDGAGGDSVFRADADMGPLSKALLVALADAPELPHVRYRLRYALARVAPEGSPPITAELVEVARFNLGPARRAQLVEILGEEQVAPAASFGQAPDVAWRLITRPVMGQLADIVYLAWRTLPEQHDEACLGQSCRDADSLHDAVHDWPDPQPADPPLAREALELSLLRAGLERLGHIQRDEQDRTAWRSPEWPETVSAGEPFIEVSLERGLGQDDAVDLVIHHDQLMDDHTRAWWERLIAFDTGAGGVVTLTTSDHEAWPRPEW